MGTNVTLDERHYKTVVEQAQALGKTPEQFLHSLIDAHARSFDEILAPARQGFDAMSDDDLQELLDRAQSATRNSQ